MTVGAGGVARIVIDNPPVNALGHPVRQALAQAFGRAEKDPNVHAIVLAAAGRTFPAGTDINEFGSAVRDPGLPELCNRIEACTKPVIAALHGTALGGGFELALAAHYRIADAKAHVGLPEVALGVLPGAGGTQRLPRIGGAAVALEMMLIGKPVAATEAARLGLIDHVARGDLQTAAQTYAEELLGQHAGPRPTRARREGLADAVAFQQTIRQYREKYAHTPTEAPRRIIDCVEAAALLPFDVGQAFEGAAFGELVESDAAQALRHVFFAERRAMHLPKGRPPARGISQVAVCGGGAEAAGWAVLALDAGLRVWLPEERGEDVLSRVSAIYSQAVLKRQMSEAQLNERMGRVLRAPEEKILDLADLVIAPEKGAPDLEAQMRATAILALMLHPGQALDGRGFARPENLVGLQTNGPAHLTKLVEVLALPGAAPDLAATIVPLMRRMGRVAVSGPGEEGGIGAAVWGACLWVAEALVAQGVDPDAVEAALRAYGFGKTPFQTRAPHVTPADPPRAVPPEEITARCLAAMANTGALLVEAGAAARPSDVDMVMIHGYGLARWRGGPMLAADQAGLLTVKKMLAGLSREDEDFWAPSALFDALIKNGRHFADLNTL